MTIAHVKINTDDDFQGHIIMKTIKCTNETPIGQAEAREYLTKWSKVSKLAIMQPTQVAMPTVESGKSLTTHGPSVQKLEPIIIYRITVDRGGPCVIISRLELSVYAWVHADSNFNVRIEQKKELIPYEYPNMACLVLKLKTKSGQIVLKELTKNHTVSDLKTQLSQKCEIPQNDLRVLFGYPPKPINLSNNSLTLDSIGVNTGDTLIVEEKKGHCQNKENENPVPKSDEMSAQIYEDQINQRGILMRKVVPADNSCLFTSIGFTLSGKIDSSCAPFMRQLIAEHVAQDTETYNEAVLGKPTEEYCKWIMKPESWGGAIELSILSAYYGIEMDVVDTLNAIINRFGEDKNYSQRIFLIFDGIHYDPLYLESLEGGDMQTIFSVSDESILQDAQLLAEEAKSSRQYTDVNKFSLKCLVCQVLMKGQAEAAEHAKTSGHTSFGEV